ncbi:hypothetical protein DM860_001036 [Cuscuta australis]|uniref:Uncharacterized protein n=1 Tax=Cuscuta australis TaxID=267555 RepID=A0A328DTN9_9ASTE|nr:hypothetical protein DM860_001036 [Cuscuta australis]
MEGEVILVEIPPQFLLDATNVSNSLLSLISAIYPNLNLFHQDPYTLMGRMILTTANDYADKINDFLIS